MVTTHPVPLNKARAIHHQLCQDSAGIKILKEKRYSITPFSYPTIENNAPKKLELAQESHTREGGGQLEEALASQEEIPYSSHSSDYLAKESEAVTVTGGTTP